MHALAGALLHHYVGMHAAKEMTGHVAEEDVVTRRKLESQRTYATRSSGFEFADLGLLQRLLVGVTPSARNGSPAAPEVPTRATISSCLSGPWLCTRRATSPEASCAGAEILKSFSVTPTAPPLPAGCAEPQPPASAGRRTANPTL